MNEDRLRRLCLAWPGVGADLKWQEDLVFSVAGKMFAALCVRGPQTGKLGFKVPDDHFLALTERPGIVPAPYAARYKWIAIAEPGDFDQAWLERMIRQSFELVAAKLPKKTRREFGLA
ncbi:MAG: MmcQ/YjbR family DNA-binding protein [Nevskia sp.]